jgi:phosphatidylglycerol:prolipoprotein diacylglycerol transferase
MYPELFSIGDFTVSTFGLMMALAFLVGTWITGRRMAEEGLDPELATTMLIWVMLGGVLGSKLYFATDVSIRTGMPFLSLLFSRDGITWYGGLIGGTLIGALGCRVHRIPIKTFADCTAVAGAVGQAIGRVGCFLVGDDYGRPTTVAWGVEFPRGAPPTTQGPVHPTQLYEIAWLLPVAGFLWWRRHKSPFLFGEYLALNGLGRIVVETWRVNPRVALGLTEPQWIGIGLIVLGMSGWIFFQRRALAAVA